MEENHSYPLYPDASVQPPIYGGARGGYNPRGGRGGYPIHTENPRGGRGGAFPARGRGGRGGHSYPVDYGIYPTPTVATGYGFPAPTE